MKIAVISDTHVQSIEELPSGLVSILCQSDMIVHLGDYNGKKLVDDMESLGNFYGVCGNMDPPSIRLFLPETRIIEIKSKRLGLIHGQGAPWGKDNRIKSRFEHVDAILYGHTHMTRNQSDNGLLLFNPGSATGRFPATRRTYGILTIGESIQAEILTLK